jgi:hypothetical protein
VTATLQLFDSNGTSVGSQANLTIPANGQVSRFINLIFPNLSAEFRGVMRITASSPLSALSLRTRYNELGNFLFAMAPTLNENASAVPGASVALPLLAIGAGYSSDILLYDNAAGGANSGSLAPVLVADTMLPR